MTTGFTYSLCSGCLQPYQDGDRCPACGATTPIQVVNGYIMGFPAETMPCASCGSNEEPVHFRGWSRMRSLIWWAEDMRRAAYVCPHCARTETTKSLAYTALLGWWSIPAWFFYGWRSTYLNWRSVWAPPANPHNWGALSASEFIALLEQAHTEEFAMRLEIHLAYCHGCGSYDWHEDEIVHLKQKCAGRTDTHLIEVIEMAPVSHQPDTAGLVAA
jgi:hypothetical protein